jgi:pentatricopeptide repeat protein
VDAIVEGSVIREGNRIRVHAQLIRASSDEHFWSETYDRELGDVLTLDSDIAQSIAAKVEVTITGGERLRLAATRHVSPEVYESYLKGMFINTNTKAGLQKRIDYFNDAINKDPGFAPAYAGLADAYTDQGSVFGGTPRRDVLPKIVAAARKAIELEPELAEAHVRLARVLQDQWKWAEAESEYKYALELKPNDPIANLGFASWLLNQGRTEDAIAWAQRGREVDPLGTAGADIGHILFHARRYDESIRELRSTLAVHPDSAVAHWFLGYTLIANGQPQEAITVLEKSVSLTDRNPAVIAILIRAYAHAGQRKKALELLSELKSRKRTGYIPAGVFVNAYLGLGDNEQAFVWLETAYNEQSTILKFLKTHPHFDPLRSDPRFVELIRRVGLDQQR